MNSKQLFTLLFALFHILVSSYGKADEKGAKPEEVSVDLHVSAEWNPLPPLESKVDGDAHAATRSALRILRAVDSETGKPYEKKNEVFNCNPVDLRRAFRLEKKEFLLGEPLLVEFRIELDGPGEKAQALPSLLAEPIGGNYRARGRDDNFLFLMHHEDGTWVRDQKTQALPRLFAPINVYMGGLCSSYQVKGDQPLSYWLPVQRWCAINRPGTYELYCFQVAHGYAVVGLRQALTIGVPPNVKKDHFFDENDNLVDSQTGKPSKRYSITSTWRRRKWEVSPLIDEIPTDVVDYAGESWSVQNVMDFAHFKIVIKRGTKIERQRMIEYWADIAESKEAEKMPAGRVDAARDAIRFAQQDDFLPLIEKWIATASQPSDFYGLAMRKSTKATAMLLKAGNPNAIAAMYYLHPARIPDVIPQLIKWLTHENNRIRAEAEMRLHTWTGQAFRRDWRGYHHQRPTLEEGRRMQPMWEEWWEENKDNFTPETR